MKSNRRNFLLMAVCAVALSACGSGGDSVSNSGESVKPSTIDGAIEKPSLKLGFIKLTDMAPLAIAKEKGFFAEEGLNVTLEPQANWKVLLDGVIGGQLDGAHMLAGQPLAATIGYGTKADLIAPLSLDLNGNAITLSNRVWAQIEPGLKKNTDGKPQHPISASALKPVIASYKEQGKQFKMGMVFPVSTHNYELRYWLAAGGIEPGYYTPGDVGGTVGAQAALSVTPPPQMPATMEAGTIDGYCVGEPWNQAAVQKKIGVPVITDDDIWKKNPEKVLGLREDFAEKYPATTAAMLRAIIKAQQWLDVDGGKNRAEAVKILARSNYVGADEAVIGASMTGQFTFQAGDTRPAPDFNIFFNDYAGYPFYSDAIWYLTQMRRWGQIADDQSDQWYFETAKAVYRPDLYLAAAKKLADEGAIPAESIPETDGFKDPQSGFIDGIVYDGKAPNAYLAKFPIGLKKGQKVTAAGVK
ncbi:MAG: nitrate/nitrite transport system substrate-binding protein [Parasphingorhabdus sp.]|jgi:nitrate/nitrite transport system substrate-binding protein|uniref:CmpA/NrtA family ABC transporter substrate-binding protein n=1 Tax=Parasphingorhabdus sp. TaxID=2709688 RepID=UPI002B26BFF7|nr:CmpA/NrtA family ABC transporter substrate-binding protein [Parasphingorhabdus sp.]|tara:strand:+ start:8073 stop:9485 length:1413 start_codon:yes stop_codon:yes gene_type:complete